MLAFACAAAEQAAAAGAHREAAAQYARALRFSDGMDPRERGAVLVTRAEECHMIADFDEAVGALEAALADYRRIGDRIKEGAVLRKLSGTLYCMGGGAQRAYAAIRSSIEILEALPPSPEPAMAYMSMASLDELGELGACPAAAIVTRRLRRRGARGLPRGPRPQTREHPAGLTVHETEVLSLLTEGLRNAQIADRLVISEKTVDHHVSAVLRKLDVRTRGEAAAEAHRLRLGAVTVPRR